VRRSLHGFDGLVHLYRAYRAISDTIFAQLALPKLALCIDGDWSALYRDILTFLQLPIDEVQIAALNERARAHDPYWRPPRQ
jgi:hypothetical protein